MKLQRPLGQYAIIGIILGLFLLTISPLLSPLLLGLLSALVVYPLFTWLQRRVKLNRVFAALLVTLFISVVFVLPLVLIGINVVQEAIAFLPRINPEGIVRDYDRFLEYLPVPRELVEENLKALLATTGLKITNLLTGLVASIPAFVFGIVLFDVTLYYGLTDGASLAQFIWETLPFQSREIAALTGTTEKICRGVVVGSLLASLIQGSILGITFWFLGVPGALLFGTLTAVFAFVPALGSLTGIGGAVYLWSQGNVRGVIVILAALGLIAISDNVVKPWVLSGSDSQLHPLLGLVGALGGLAVFGFAGLFLGPLFAALAVVVLNVLRDQR